MPKRLITDCVPCNPFEMRFLPLSFFCLLASLAVATGAPLKVHDLRVDGMVDPLGVDSSRTYLSWKLESEDRGARQTAWEVLAASSAEKLAAGEGDLWSTGRREGDRQVQIRYRGNGPESAQQIFWKVRVWNEDGEVSDWSEPATWTAGLLSQDDWKAQWLASPDWLEFARPHLGYRSLPADDIHTEKWIQLDLGQVYEIDDIRLHGLMHSVTERLGLPMKYVVELATKSDFSDAVVVADTRDEPVNMWRGRHNIEVDGVDARYFRLTAPELRNANGEIALAFSQIEILSDNENVALGTEVTATDSLEQGPWAASAVVDGMGLPGSVPIATETVLLRDEFAVKPELKRALVFVSGQGQYHMAINGKDLLKGVISPGWTDTEETVLYDTFDVTELLNPGINAVGISLAGGMYNVPDPQGRYTKFISRYQPLKAIFQLRLEYADGSVETIVSDDSWRTRSGATTYSHIYGGEVYDARLVPTGWTEPGFEADDAWQSAVVTEGPGGFLRGASHAAPPVRTIETLKPVNVDELEPGVTVYDLGQNASLMIRLRVRGPAGSMIRIEPSELLNDDGSIDPGSTRRGLASWDYVLAGKGETEEWQARFFYHGARYLQVTATPAEGGDELPVVEAIEGLITHSSSEPVGEFACSSELWTQTRQLIRWSQRSNMVSVLTDCPHRERLGWLEQYHLNGPSLRYEFDLGRLFHKAFGDMADAQTPEGLVPGIAPEYVVFPNDFRDSTAWGSAIFLAAWQQYLFSGDDRAFQEQYNAMQDYFAYLSSQATNYIIDDGLGDWYDLGPNHPGYAQLTPIGLTATAIYYRDAMVLAEVAAHRTRWGEAAAYAERAEHIRRAFNEAFFNEETGSYATGSQTANAMPYVLGMVPEGREDEVFAALVKALEANDYGVTAGDVGHRYLLRALAKGGRPDLVYAMHHRTDRPGYGWQIVHGKTSLTEAWDGGSSQNHFMLGHIMEWFYRHLVGIAPDPEQPGFKNIIIKPQPVRELEWAEASYESVRGPISVRWERENDRFDLRVSVPANATATVFVPATDVDEVSERGRPIADRENITFLRQEDGHAVFSVASGDYHFNTKDPL